MAKELTDLEQALAEKTREAEQLTQKIEELNQSKAKYLSTVSHEIRAPLSGIIGLSELMLEDKLSADHKRCVQLMNSSAKTTQLLASNLLDFSKIERGIMDVESAVFSITETRGDIDYFFAPIIQSQSIDFDCSFEDGFETWRLGDAYKLRQILTSLISTSTAFTNKGQISLRFAGDEEGIRIEIEDTGVGIPVDELKSLEHADARATTDTGRKFGGIGLNLTISRLFCDLLSGSIEVKSEKGKGTLFKVSLPFKASPPEGA